MAERVKVIVRVRPLLKFQSQPAWIIKNNSLIALEGSSKTQRNSSASTDKKSTKRENNEIDYQFNYENVVTESVTSEQMYKQHIKQKLLDNLDNSRNMSIMAYGQTCSGKTHTILGVKEAPGIIPCVLRQLFQFKQNKKCSFKLSYIQIYNQKIGDLLCKKQQKQLKIIQDSKWGCEVTNSTKQPITNFQQALNVLQRGQKQRQYGQGQYHQHSSRSHTLLRIFVQQWDNNYQTKSFVITIVDLAGSERLQSTLQSSAETGFINKSLFQLANVIAKLADKNSAHIPFRDSKLTRLLEHSLSGDGSSLLICCISPAKTCFGQALSTLRLAERAKKIQLKQDEIAPALDIQNLKQKLKLKTKQCQQMKNQIDQMNKKIKQIQQQLANVKSTKISKTGTNKADLLILMDHQNFTFFINDKIHEPTMSAEISNLKQKFLSQMQQLYQDYAHEITKLCKSDEFQLQIEQVCFMNMLLQQQKINQYRLMMIDELLRQNNDSGIDQNLKFYRALQKYRDKLIGSNSRIASSTQSQHDQSKFKIDINSTHKRGTTQLSERENSQRMSYKKYSSYSQQIHESPSLQLNNYHQQEQYGSQILIWGCRKDFRVCKGNQNSLNMIKINNIGLIKSVVCGYHHTFALTKQGKIYGWGKNTQRQILPINKDSIASPTQIKINNTIVMVAAGWGHSIALTSNGEIYSWGYGKDGQLGQGNQQNQTNPSKIEHNNNVIAVYAGHSHSAFLDSCGEIYTFGFNLDYRLMIGDQKVVFCPKKVPIRDVVEASLGVSHSAIITSNGSVYCGGVGTHGQLGVRLDAGIVGWQKMQVIDRKFEEQPFQKICPLVQIEGFNRRNKAIKVNCGENTTMILDERGELFTFGKSMGGRIGHNNPSPTKLMSNIDLIASGCRHSLAYIQNQNKLYSWGLNMYGQANPSITGDLQQPEIIQGLPNNRILGLSCGFFHSAILYK